MDVVRDRAPAGSVAGLYGPGSEAWQLNREATILLGAGPRALLMQIAHPLVAEGVDQHSGFREDPWGRLQATIRSYLRIVYGTGAEAQAEIRRLNGLHRSIRGPIVDPVALSSSGKRRYRARDPELLMWVHATLIDSTFVAYDAWIEPLSRPRRERAYRETRPIGLALGVPDGLLPPDLAAFEAYMARMVSADSPIVVTPTARVLARTILHPPLEPILRTFDGRPGPAEAGLRPIGPLLAPILRAIPSRAYEWTLWPAVQLLPERLRREFGVDWSPMRGAAAAWLLAGFRLWRPLLPTAFRWMPAARRADRRVADARIRA